MRKFAEKQMTEKTIVAKW